MATSRKQTRKMRAENGEHRVVKSKFMEERQQRIQSKPLVPMSDKQREYIKLINEKPVVIATGFAGSSKTYIPTVMAADMYKTGAIDKIIVTRPAVSSSKSMGYFKGSETEKMSVWLQAVIPILKGRLGAAELEIAITAKDIEFIPLETIKGMSISNAWLLVEEASDLTKEEVIKIVTRMGKGSRLTLSGDLRQSELRETSGLKWLVNFVNRHNLDKSFGFIDFNDVNDIVRSDAVREFIVCLVRDEKKDL